VASKRTKRAVVATAVSASLMIGGAALAASENSHRCDHKPNNGKGDMVGAPGKGKGKGWENGWPGKCAAQNGGGDEDGDNSGGGSPGGGSPGGGSPGGGSPGGGSGTPVPPAPDSGDESLIDIAVNVEVGLPSAALQSGLGIATDGGTINIIAALLASL
jgi:hypothetical protein